MQLVRSEAAGTRSALTWDAGVTDCAGPGERPSLGMTILHFTTEVHTFIYAKMDISSTWFENTMGTF